MLFAMRFNTPFRMFRLLTVQGGSVHVDMRFNFEKCYNIIFCAIYWILHNFI